MLFAGVLLLAAGPFGQIVGRWESTSGPQKLEFRADGTVFMSTIGPARRGVYEVGADNVLRIRLEGGGRFAATVRMPNRDQLILVDPDGSFTNFRRVE